MDSPSTYFLHCYIAGLQYYEVLEVWKKLEIGQTLDLTPETDNRYDKHAVIVAFEGKKLGYLPRSQNKAVSQILQAGMMPIKRVFKACIQKTRCTNELRFV